MSVDAFVPRLRKEPHHDHIRVADSAGRISNMNSRISRRFSSLLLTLGLSGVSICIAASYGAGSFAAETAAPKIDKPAIAIAEPITPVPLTSGTDEKKVQLGRQLFNDSRLSGGNGVSCATCHAFERGLSDGAKISRGLPGNPHILNSPTLYNVGLNPKVNWSGNMAKLETQMERVIESKRAMGAKWDNVVATLRNDTELTAAFNAIYQDGVQKRNIIDAVVEFEKSLITPNAPFDRYLRGDDNAINADAKAGYELFKNLGCSSCHQGVNVGGNMLQVFGIFGDPATVTLGKDTPGSAADSGIADDRPVFRVPPLRNVEVTAPYFHDGSAASLPEAIRVMAEYQLGSRISNEDIGKIEEFLKSLTGEYQNVSVRDLK